MEATIMSIIVAIMITEAVMTITEAIIIIAQINFMNFMDFIQINLPLLVIMFQTFLLILHIKK